MQKNHAPMAHPKESAHPTPLGPDLSHRDLRGQILRGQDFQGADFSGCDLRFADLRGSDLFGARLRNARLDQCKFEMTRIVEIWIPQTIGLEVVNQIRAFDFSQVMTRFVGPNSNSETLSCPYKDSSLRPILYEWGSRSWAFGAGWTPPQTLWTLEEIVAAVLDELGCTHHLSRPYRSSKAVSLEASW